MPGRLGIRQRQPDSECAVGKRKLSRIGRMSRFASLGWPDLPSDPQATVMKPRYCLIVIQLVLIAARCGADDEVWHVSGRVVDSEGRAVAAAGVSSYWSANGVSGDEFRALLKQKDIQKNLKKLWSHEGQMEPLLRPTKTDARGAFTVNLKANDYKFYVIDKDRKRGAIVTVDSMHPPENVDVVLEPLVRVHGVIRLASRNQPLSWTSVLVSLPLNERFPLGRDRLAICGSFESRFEFWLPPGRYVLHANNDESPNAETVPDHAIAVTGDQPAVDVGTLVLAARPNRAELTDQSKLRGTWGDYTKHYGRKPPAWNISDARGVDKDVRISDFKGKWVLLYLWSATCVPCLKNGLPNLIEFHETHAEYRDQYAILALCLSKDGDIETIEKLDRQLEPVVKNVWRQPLPFPVLLDSTFKSWENFGLDGVGHLLLIDPAGSLVKGGQKTLSRHLRNREMPGAPRN